MKGCEILYEGLSYLKAGPLCTRTAHLITEGSVYCFTSLTS